MDKCPVTSRKKVTADVPESTFLGGVNDDISRTLAVELKLQTFFGEKKMTLGRQRDLREDEMVKLLSPDEPSSPTLLSPAKN